MNKTCMSGIRLYNLEGDWEILVGKTARDNDYLSTKLGKPADFWFHVAGMPGSHVVARHPQKPEQCPREIKRVAGGLAAFFGKGKNGGKVAVHWSTCRFVTKPRGAEPGKVQLKRHETLMAEPLDPDEYFGGME
jgi:predicted ribosome quality control (RQC) complex YloA/Tae2 family protein